MIDYKKYHDEGYTEWQIEEIKLAVKNNVQDDLIEKYLCNVDYDHEQMQEVRKGLVNGIDVSLYASTGIPATEMVSIRKQLQYQQGVRNEASEKYDLANQRKLELDNKDHEKLHISLVAMAIGMGALSLVIAILCVIIVVLLLKA